MVQEETTLITNYTFQSVFDVLLLPPPFYFLAEELILIVALQQGSLSIPGSSSLLSAAAERSEREPGYKIGCGPLLRAHFNGSPFRSYKARIVFHVILVNLAAGKGIGFPCELLIRLPRRGERH